MTHECWLERGREGGNLVDVGRRRSRRTAPTFILERNPLAETRKLPVHAENNVIEKGNSKELPSISQAPGDFEVLHGGLRVSTGVIVCNNHSRSRLS